MDYRKEDIINLLDGIVGRPQRNILLSKTLNFPKIDLDDMLNKKYIEEILINELAIFPNEDDSIIDLITLYQEGNQIAKESNTELYAENIKAYKEYIKIVSQIVKEIAIEDNAISISLIIDRLMYNGYFSRKFKYDVKLEDALPNITGYLGINIINGEGCCRHEAILHKDIFTELNLPCIALAGYYDIVIALETVFQSMANHIISIIEFDGALYSHNHFYDQIGYFQNALKIKNYGPKCIDNFYYKPSMDMYWNSLSHKSLIDCIFCFNDDSKKPHLGEEEINLIRKESGIRYIKSHFLKYELKEVTKEYAKKIIPGTIE